MDLAAQARALTSQPFLGRPVAEEEAYGWPPALLLPVLTRSLSLLTLLLQDGAVDLDLASSVAGLDPGLAFGILQAANRHREAGSEPIWQLPLAVVAAGRESVGQLVERAPRMEDCGHPGKQLRLRQLVTNAVVRGCVSYLLARELGGCQPRKAYLAALLLELPVLARLASAGSSQVELLSVLCHTLPSAMVRAVMAGKSEPSGEDTREPMVATSLIAQAVLELPTAEAESSPWVEDLASRRVWDCWQGTDARQRMALLSHCCGMARWAAAHLHNLDPWEFMARLEQGNTRG